VKEKMPEPLAPAPDSESNGSVSADEAAERVPSPT
jgi:hypothetical protein